MDTGAKNKASATSVGNVNADFDVESDKVVFLEGESPNGEVIEDLGIDSIALTRLELSLAGFSEKITNLRIFMMRLATMEGELEAFAREKDHTKLDSFEKGLQFDLLSGILESEVGELDKFLNKLKTEIADAGQRISSCSHLGETSMVMKEKLCDFEQYLKQSEEQLSVIKMQSAYFQRKLSSFKREENGNGDVGEIVREDDQYLNVNAEINMRTTEQQRNVLRMLEKSLAREMDLEKNLNDSIQIEEELKLRISSLEQELVHTEEEATDVWEKWFEADNASQILTGISRDILGRLQISQFNLTGLVQRESDLRDKLVLANSEAFTLGEKVSSLENQLKESEGQVLNTKASVDLLERQLKESDLRLQHAVASAEASQEKQNMLYSTIEDMENVIKDLKSNVSKAESRADSAEEKCIVLSESNAELNEELSFLRSRLECLEESLHQVEEAKVASAKDIGMHIMNFKTLVTQLAVERERLNKQISSLAFENKILVVKLEKTYKDPPQGTNGSDGDSGSSAREIKEEVFETSVTGQKVDRTEQNLSANEDEMKPEESMPDIRTLRRVDGGVLNFKHLLIATLVLLLSAVTFFVFKRHEF